MFKYAISKTTDTAVTYLRIEVLDSDYALEEPMLSYKYVEEIDGASMFSSPAKVFWEMERCNENNKNKTKFELNVIKVEFIITPMAMTVSQK